MARPMKKRRICGFPANKTFRSSDESRISGEIQIFLDEYELIRLIDYEGLTQEEDSSHMNLTRTTVQNIYSEVRGKISKALVEGGRIVISGGYYSLCESRRKKKSIISQMWRKV